MTTFLTHLSALNPKIPFSFFWYPCTPCQSHVDHCPIMACSAKFCMSPNTRTLVLAPWGNT